MRQPLPTTYYEEKLFNKYDKVYVIEPIDEWHGLRTQVRVFCQTHEEYRNVYLKKVFNGQKHTHPCRKCCLTSDIESE